MQQCHYCGEFTDELIHYFGHDHPAGCWPCGAEANQLQELPGQSADPGVASMVELQRYYETAVKEVN